MPRLGHIDNNFLIYMYNDDHPPPHVHVIKRDKTVDGRFNFDGSFHSYTKGSKRYDADELKYIRKFLIKHKNILEYNWKIRNTTKPIKKIN